MKPKSIYENRSIRYRNGTAVLVIPAPLSREMGFKVRERTNPSEEDTVINSKNEKAMLYIWLNRNNEIEFCDASKPMKNTNGAVIKDGLHPHNKSCEITIPWDIRNTYDYLGITLGKVIIFKDEHDHVVVKPKLNSNLEGVSQIKGSS